MKACFEPTDLSELTRDIAALFLRATERAGLAFERRTVDEETPCTAAAAARRDAVAGPGP
jgi:hypothetical protein